jgi:hypothetical protein
VSREKRDTVKRRRLLRPSSAGRKGAYLYVPAVELERAGRLDATHYTVWGTERGGLLVRLYQDGPDEEEDRE